MAEAFLEEQLRRIRAMSEQMSRVRALYDVNQERTQHSDASRSSSTETIRRAPVLIARIVLVDAVDSLSRGRARLVRVRCRRADGGTDVPTARRRDSTRALPRLPAGRCSRQTVLRRPGSNRPVRIPESASRSGATPSVPCSSNRMLRTPQLPIVGTLAIVSWNIHEGSGERRRVDSAASVRRVHLW